MWQQPHHDAGHGRNAVGRTLLAATQDSPGDSPVWTQLHYVLPLSGRNGPGVHHKNNKDQRVRR
jgi:hypothetical protein